MSSPFLRSQAWRTGVTGFSLIEVMVVLVVLGVISAMAVISFRNDPLTQLEREQFRLQGLLKFAADEAVLQGVLLGLSADNKSYQLVFFDSKEQLWQTGQDRYYSAYSLPESITLSIALDGDSFTEQEQQHIALLVKASAAEKSIVEQRVPSILFLASGEITPFTLTLQHLLADKPLQLISDGFSEVRAN